MRNLKKILALVLALVMSMSLLATANASFSDKDKIDPTYAEAVEVLNGLNVFKGRTDGNFDPKAGITRAEVAAIIYRIVTGDVEDKQVKLYSDYNKFADVNSGSWYAGYVNFCANGEYIKGYPDGKFGPNDAVTGYQALAMILRAVGYDKNGEFTGKEWQVQTAAVAKSLGITNNIIPGTLNTAASRETVAEILFRAILVPTVEYTPAYGYRTTDTSLGMKTFKLEYVKGVVTANEYANLYGNSPKAEGKTVLATEGKDRTLAITTKVTDLGETHYAYVTGSKVLYMAKTGNTTYENKGAAVDIGSSSKFSKVTGLAKDGENYVNFGGDADAYKSEYRIEFTVKFADADAKKDFEENYGKVDGMTEVKTLEYEKSIRAGKDISAADMAVIEGIFAAADGEDKTDGIQGAVYVGTKSAAEDKDISDEMSFSKFKKEYIEDDTDHVKVNDADNGEWLKVIDNDGDGEADYVFRIDFTMAQIIDVTKKKVTYTIGEEKTEIAASDIVTEDELAVGDVVLYTEIDGVYYVDVVTPVTETIAKRAIDYKNETFVVGDTTYSWSGIEKVTPNGWYDDIDELYTEVAYDLYQDHFGYVRMATESAYNRGFALLLDGWYDSDGRTADWKAEIYNAESDKREDVEVLDGKKNPAETFIDSSKNSGDKDWGRLIEAGQVYFGYDAPTDAAVEAKEDPYLTNIAAFTMGDDGYALNKVQYASNKSEYKAVELELVGANGKAVAVDKKALDQADSNVAVQVTTNTQYYMVTKNSNGKIVDVIDWVGYANAPADAALNPKALVGYAVVTESTSKYDVAHVVVFETLEAVSSNVGFVFALDQIRFGDRSIDAYFLGYDAANEAFSDDMRKEINASSSDIKLVGELLRYAVIDSEGNLILVQDDQFEDYNIFTGVCRTNADVNEKDYVYIDVADGSENSFKPSALKDQQYIVVEHSKDWNDVRSRYEMAALEEDYEDGDKLIFMTNNKGDIQYVINVSESYDDDTKNSYGKIDLLNTTYETIEKSYTVEKFDAAKEAVELLKKANWDAKDLATAEKAYNELKNGNAAEKALADELDAMIKLTVARNAAQAGYDKIIDETVEANAGTSSEWPAGAAEAAKEKVAKELAKMDLDALKALKPAKGDKIWNGTIVPTVEGFQTEAGEVENAQKTAIEKIAKEYNNLNPKDKAAVQSIYDKAVKAIKASNKAEEIEKLADQAVADIFAKLNPAEIKAADKLEGAFVGLNDYIVTSGVTLEQNGKELTLKGTVPQSAQMNKDFEGTVPGFGSADDCLGYVAKGSTSFAIIPITMGGDTLYLIVGDMTKIADTKTIGTVTGLTINVDLKW